MNKQDSVEAVLIGELKYGYGGLGCKLSEDEAEALLVEIVTQDDTSPTGFRYLNLPNEHEPATCGDGRSSRGLLSGAGPRLRYKMFGGDLQVNWEAQELTGGFQLGTIKNDNPKAGPIERVRDFMEKVMVHAYHRAAGAHTSTEHAKGPNCGCGAIDNHTASLETVVREYDDGKDELVELTRAVMTTDFDEDLHESLIVPNARVLADEERKAEYNGSVFLEIVRSQGVAKDAGLENIEDLVGEHDESLMIVNLTDYTLDRDKFVKTSDKQVFWIDEPAIRHDTARYAKNDIEAARLYQAAMTMQVAKAKALSRSGMRIAVLQPGI